MISPGKYLPRNQFSQEMFPEIFFQKTFQKIPELNNFPETDFPEVFQTKSPSQKQIPRKDFPEQNGFQKYFPGRKSSREN